MPHHAPPEGWADFAKDMGLRLQRLRQSLGMTQEQVAYAADLTRSHYQQLEKGQSRPGVPANPSLLTLASLAGVFGVPISEIIPDVDEPRLRKSGA